MHGHPSIASRWGSWRARAAPRRRRRACAGRRVDRHRGRDGDAGRSPCAVSGVTVLTDALLATGFPYDRRTSADNNFDAFVTIKKRCQAVRRCGSAALDLCLSPTAPTTVLSASCGRIAAGARSSSAPVGGSRPTRGRRSIPAGEPGVTLVATNGLVHDALVGVLSQVPISHRPVRDSSARRFARSRLAHFVARPARDRVSGAKNAPTRGRPVTGEVHSPLVCIQLEGGSR